MILPCDFNIFSLKKLFYRLDKSQTFIFTTGGHFVTCFKSIRFYIGPLYFKSRNDFNLNFTITVDDGPGIVSLHQVRVLRFSIARWYRFKLNRNARRSRRRLQYLAHLIVRLDQMARFWFTYQLVENLIRLFFSGLAHLINPCLFRNTILGLYLCCSFRAVFFRTLVALGLWGAW